MYEELVKRLREISMDFGESDHISVMLLEAANAIESTNKAYQMISEAYEAEVTKQNWIPVTERLPEIDEKHHRSKDVLVYLDGGYMAFSALEENIFGQTWFECERHPDIEEEMVVTHWMPLPELPKEEA